MLCPRCFSSGISYKQDATVFPAAAGAAGQGPRSTNRAQVKFGNGKKLTVTRKRAERYGDRDRNETMVMVIDQKSKFQRESWHDPVTGEENFKSAKLSGNPGSHGAASEPLFKVRQRPDERD